MLFMIIWWLERTAFIFHKNNIYIYNKCICLVLSLAEQNNSLFFLKITNLLFILVIVCRWHCMICFISLLHSPSLPSLFLHVDPQPHYHSMGNAITSPLVFLSTSSSVLFPQTLSLPPCHHIHFHPSPILPQFFCCFTFTCFFLIMRCPSSLCSITLSTVLFCFSLSWLPVALHRMEQI